MTGRKDDSSKPASYLLAHDVVINDHSPSYDIQFYAARLREWWNKAGTLPALQVNNDDYFGIVDVLEFGAAKYAPRNWEAGILYSRVFRAAMDHYARRGGEDEETGLPHRHHFLCCYMFLAAYPARGLHTFDNRPGLPELVSAEGLDRAIEQAREEGRLCGFSQGYDHAQAQVSPAMDSDGYESRGRTL